MEHIWRMTVAVFFISIAVFLLVFAYVFQGAVISTVSMWISFALMLLGIGKGAFAIIDHNDEMKKNHQE